MNDTLKTLLTRRSCRSYQKKPVADEALAQILEAGTFAASGGNRQSAIMIDVRNADAVAALEKMNASFTPDPGGHPFYGAPNVILVLAERDGGQNAIKDGSLVMGNLMLAAASLGVGSCWINRAYEMFESDEGKALLRRWGVAGDYIGIGACILGYPEGDAPQPAPRKENYIYTV